MNWRRYVLVVILGIFALGSFMFFGNAMALILDLGRLFGQSPTTSNWQLALKGVNATVALILCAWSLYEASYHYDGDGFILALAGVSLLAGTSAIWSFPPIFLSHLFGLMVGVVFAVVVGISGLVAYLSNP